MVKIKLFFYKLMDKWNKLNLKRKIKDININSDRKSLGLVDMSVWNELRTFDTKTMKFKVLFENNRRINFISRISYRLVLYSSNGYIHIFDLKTNKLINKFNFNYKLGGLLGTGMVKRVGKEGFLLYESDGFYIVSLSYAKNKVNRFHLIKHVEHTPGNYELSITSDIFVFSEVDVYAMTTGQKNGKCQRVLYRLQLKENIFNYTSINGNGIVTMDTILCKHQIDYSKWGTSMGVERILFVGPTTFIIFGSVYLQYFDFFKGPLKVYMFDNLNTKIIRKNDWRVDYCDNGILAAYEFEYIRWLSVRRYRNIVDAVKWKCYIVYSTQYSVFLVNLYANTRNELFKIKTKRRFKIVSINIVQKTLIVTIIERNWSFCKTYIIKDFLKNGNKKISLNSEGLFI